MLEDRAQPTGAAVPTPSEGDRIRRDKLRLHELGYAQELRRHMSGFSNFAVSFTIISILSGCLTLYGFGMNTGGPVLIMWGWPFTEFVNNTGWSSTLYVALLGLLLAQYTFTGYDASAHMTEETLDASISGPRGIVMSILVSLAAGWVLLIGVTFAIQDYDAELASETGVPPAQIFIDAAGAATGKFLLLVVIGAQLFCGMSVLFMLPQVYPITSKSFNYTPVAVLVVAGFAGVWWMVSARRWFKGPKVQGTQEELAAIERDLESVA
jgi:amino acid transporter